MQWQQIGIFARTTGSRPTGLVFPTPDGQWRWEVWRQSTCRDENWMDTGRTAPEWGLVGTETEARETVQHRISSPA